MAQRLQLLIAEDNPADAELLIRALRRSGFAPEWKRVDNKADFVAGLHDGLELVLSDFDMPQFTGFEALHLVQQRLPDVPLIIISGTIGEEVAVEAMRRGAADYLLKDRMSRLGPAVKQTLARGRLQGERRQAVEALRQSEERFRGLIENSTDVITVIDGEGRICFQSPSTQRVLGYAAEEFMGRNSFDFVAPEDAAKVRDGIKRALAGNVVPMPVEYRIRHRDGTWRIFQSIGRSMTDPTGRQQVVINSRDMTETRKLEHQFLRAQRLEAIGTLSSGIAHDLNNILAPMMMIAPLLKEKVSDRQDLEMLAMIEQGARRGANIIKQLLTFSRGIEGERGPVQARHLVKEMGEIMRETFPREITVEEKIATNLRPITADATQIHQVLMNLCVNARDAMPKAGKITLAAQNLTIEEIDSRTVPQRVPGLYVCLTVADTGEGIPPENLDRIFELSSRPRTWARVPDSGCPPCSAS